jgi:hypothetical protein
MDEETQKDTRQMMQKKNSAPPNNQPIRAKYQAKKKNGSKQGRPEEENFVKKQVSLSIQRAYPLSQQGIQ